MLALRTHLRHPAMLVAIVALLSSFGGYAMAAGTIGSKQLKRGAVTESKIARRAITVTKIKDGQVTSSKLAANAVTSSRIKDGAIVAADLAPGTAVQGTGQAWGKRLDLDTSASADAWQFPGVGSFKVTCNAVNDISVFQNISTDQKVRLVGSLTYNNGANWVELLGGAEINGTGGIGLGTVSSNHMHYGDVLISATKDGATRVAHINYASQFSGTGCAVLLSGTLAGNAPA